MVNCSTIASLHDRPTTEDVVSESVDCVPCPAFCGLMECEAVFIHISKWYVTVQQSTGLPGCWCLYVYNRIQQHISLAGWGFFGLMGLTHMYWERTLFGLGLWLGTKEMLWIYGMWGWWGYFGKLGVKQVGEDVCSNIKTHYLVSLH